MECGSSFPPWCLQFVQRQRTVSDRPAVAGLQEALSQQFSRLARDAVTGTKEHESGDESSLSTEDSKSKRMANPAEQPDSLDTGMTRAGDLRGKPASAPHADVSLGDLGTNADIAGSISDLGGGGIEFGEAEEILDLAKRYEIGATLGRGGMGHVVQAVDRKLKRPVAIKQLLAEYSGSSKAWQRFLTEAQSIAALNHFNIIQIFDYGLTREGPFLVMEFVDGPSLADRLADGALEQREAGEIAAQLAEALHVAHQRGIIHRDIKPANVLLTSTGTPKLGDFGLARQDDADVSQHTQAGAVLGTLDYMSPEQRQDASRADARSDQWSLAASLYELLAGDVPRVIRPDRLPEALRDVVMQALEDDPAKRFPSGQAFADALRQAGAAAVTSQASGDRSSLKTGQCIHCQTINDPANAFCESCGRGLKDPCLQCEAPVGAWAQFCPQCGTDQAELLQSQLTELMAERQEIEALRRGYRHGEALARLAPLRALERSEFTELKEWAESATERYQTEFEQLTVQRDGVLTEARERFSANELSAAIKLLEGLPEPLRTSETQQLLNDATARRDELKDLSQRIRTAVKDRAYDGLLPDVERFLELRPDDAQALKMRDRLRQREQQRARTAAAAGDELSNKYTDDSRNGDSPDGQPLRRSRRRTGQEKQAAQRKRLLVGGGLLAGVLLLIGLGFLGGDGETDGTGLELANTDPTEIDRTATGVRAGAETAPQRANGNEVAETTQSDARVEGIRQPAVKPPPATAPFDTAQAKAHQQAWADYLGVPLESTNSIGMKFVVIPPGEFMMGSGQMAMQRGAFCTEHRVTLTKPFELGVYEVTQEQYERVIGTNPSAGRGDQNPVQKISWDDAIEFCRKLSSYPEEKAAGCEYRLPTEAEWEYACRAGTTTRYSFGDDDSNLDDYALYGTFSEQLKATAGPAPYRTPGPVGTKRPNPWGLYDMHGNVWEWCQDWFGDYPDAPVTDPQGPSSSLTKSFRGGSFWHDAKGCQSAYRHRGDPNRAGNNDLGFRVVRTRTRPEPSTVTASVESDNWRSLFNGRDLTGWVPEVPPGGEGNPQSDWSVSGGTISSLGVGHNWLASEEEFENFTFSFEWRFPTGFQQGVNGSGVVVVVSGLNSILFDPKGIEIDLLPTRQGRPTGTLITYDTALVHASGIGDRLGNSTFEPTGDWIRPAGQWNSGTIICQGNTLTVEINGQKVNSGTAPAGVRGKICLRNQKSRVEFRNLRIKTDQPAPVRDRKLFDHVSLEGWSVGYISYTKDRTPHRWRAKLGRIVCSGEDQDYLITGESFRNYVLEVDWRFPATGPQTPNGSGVVIHCSGTNFQDNPQGYEINLPAVSHAAQVANRDKDVAIVTGGVITYGVTAENHSGTATGVRSENRQLKALAVPPLKPDGSTEFNRLKVIAIDNTIQVWVNDTIVNDVWNLNTTAGRIALRSQGTAVEFSRVVIRELTGKTKAEMQRQLR